MNSIKIIENFLDDVEEIIDFAKSLDFYTADEHPHPDNNKIVYPGIRTENLELLEPSLAKKIIKNVLDSYFGMEVEYRGSEVSFQYSDDSFNRGIIHRDRALTCIVYLNNPTNKNNGTSFYELNGKIPEIDTNLKFDYIRNKQYDKFEMLCEKVEHHFIKSIDVKDMFNRAVIFPGTKFHAANGFSKDLNGNQRLFLVIHFTGFFKKSFEEY